MHHLFAHDGFYGSTYAIISCKISDGPGMLLAMRCGKLRCRFRQCRFTACQQDAGGAACGQFPCGGQTDSLAAAADNGGLSAKRYIHAVELNPNLNNLLKTGWDSR